MLSTMVREFEHDSFTDLKVLLDDDAEKDFFENIKHIQVWEKYSRQELSNNFQDKILLASADIFAPCISVLCPIMPCPPESSTFCLKYTCDVTK